MKKLSLLKVANQEFNAVLQDQDCTIQIRQIGDYVYFSLWSGDTLICQNRLVVTGLKILQNSPFDFIGDFVFLDAQDETGAENPNYEQFEDRFILIYLESQDLEVTR